MPEPSDSIVPQPGQIVTRLRPPEDTDVVIVGAGVAGLYCAWRLLQQEPKTRVAVLEAMGRTGGRLDTDRLSIDGHEVRDEEGGMRFNESMTELYALLRALGLESQVVPFGMGGGANRYFLRGRGFTRAEAEAGGHAIWSELFRLEENERGKSPGQIIGEVYAAVLAENGVEPPASPSPEFWSRFRNELRYQDVRLNEWGLWALLRTYGLSQECITMLADTVGFFGPFEADVNAGDAFQILEDFPQDPTFFALEQGFSTLTDTLVEKIVAAGGRISTGVTVDALEREGEEGLAVRWSATPDVWLDDLETGVTRCERVILAVPSRTLGGLFASSPVLQANPRLRRALSGVEGLPLLKINLYYEHAWWRDGSHVDPPISAGPSFTDLPAGSAYVFDPIPGESADGPAGLTIYCDFAKTNFWNELQAIGPRFTSKLQEQYAEQVPQVLFAASQRVVVEATRQLERIFQASGLPAPVLTSFRSWDGTSQFGFAYHQYARGVDDRRLAKMVVRPIPGLEIFACNEAFSDQQGWVNGSLRSADRVLVELGLGPLE